MQHFEVQVRASRATRLAHQCNDLPFLHLVSDGNAVFRIMRVARRVTVAMVDFDHDAVAVAITRPGHYAVRNRDDLVTTLAGEIDAGMVRRLAREWVSSLAEIRRQPA